MSFTARNLGQAGTEPEQINPIFSPAGLKLQLQRELEPYVNGWRNENDGVRLVAVDEHWRRFEGEIDGPLDTPYEGGTFKLELIIPEAYPAVPPSVKYLTRVWHPNINFVTGATCVDFWGASGQWTVGMDMRFVLVSLRLQLGDPELQYPLDERVAKQYQNYPTMFKDTARYWTAVNAGGPGFTVEYGNTVKQQVETWMKENAGPKPGATGEVKAEQTTTLSKEGLTLRMQNEVERHLNSSLNDDHGHGVRLAEVDDSSWRNFEGEIDGPPGTPYEGGKFKVQLVVPEGYPAVRPAVKYLTRVWHPSINPLTGATRVNFCGHSGQWNTAMDLRTLLIFLRMMLANDDFSAHPHEKVKHCHDPKKFRDTARHWTAVYAGGPHLLEDYEASVQQLVKKMGVDEHAGRYALATHCWDVGLALEYLAPTPYNPLMPEVGS